MVKDIVKDVLFLGQKSVPATMKDMQVAIDLQDTLNANREGCVGLAANMIGVKKNIIIVNMGLRDIVMFNPVIKRKDTPYETEEGCLCHEGEQKVTRYAVIEVAYMDHAFKLQRKVFTGFNAQIIQHEIDHCNGILI